ncbi:hypothetical protein RRG08_040202 [Elysia crispata]|uniref:Uncharacterized protein n=1 Tax=Elysia crispata TaxID=231223 RepID=A0AAE1CP05_9GAST|nr:hypothetical protein RRG08_040202 [Elysia crispata]
MRCSCRSALRDPVRAKGLIFRSPGSPGIFMERLCRYTGASLSGIVVKNLAYRERCGVSNLLPPLRPEITPCRTQRRHPVWPTAAILVISSGHKWSAGNPSGPEEWVNARRTTDYHPLSQGRYGTIHLGVSRQPVDNRGSQLFDRCKTYKN